MHISWQLTINLYEEMSFQNMIIQATKQKLDKKKTETVVDITTALNT